MLLKNDNKSYWQPEIKKLIREQLKIPGLHVMGYYSQNKASKRLPNHYHKMAEYTVLIKGNQQFFVDDTLYTLHGGDIFSTNPYEYHGNNGEFQEICEFIWFQLDLSDPGIDFLGLSKPQSTFLYEQICSNPFRVKSAVPEDLQLLKKAFFLLADQSDQKHLLGQSYLVSFVVNNLLKGEEPTFEANSHAAIRKALQYIDGHFDENLNIVSLAEYTGLSPSRFQILFKADCGITPHAYITDKRIEKAKQLLAEGNYSVTDLAYMFNFSSSNHFSTTFKKLTGMSPTQYQKKAYADQNKNED